MRCRAWVKWKAVGKKKLKKKPSMIISMYNHYVRGMPLTDAPPKGYKQRYKEEDLVQCDGQVAVSVRVSIDGGCACCGSVELEVEYKCNKCGNTDFPELPNDKESLSDFLTGFFAGMEEDHRFQWLMDEKAKQEKDDAKMKKQQEGMQKKIEQNRERALKKKREKIRKHQEKMQRKQ